MDKIRTIIIDDEPKAIAVLERYCNDVDSIILLISFRDPIKAINFLQHNEVSLIFLDINMPKISGLEFLKIIKNQPKIVFTTAYSEYATDSYSYDAVDYLLKPIDFPRFVKAVTKTKQLLDMENSTTRGGEISEHQVDKIIYIKSGPQLYKVNSSEILYLEKDGNYLIFHTKDKKMLSRQNMKDIFEILDSDSFIRVHKSFIVALKHIEIIESHQIRIGNLKIPVGRNYREDLMKITQNSH
jgi:DNA-binding LytR/AlgR family response regulator